MHFNQLTNSVYAPIPIGNCHQSIYKEAPVSPPFARLVHGFSGPGGVDTKVKLLALEGAQLL